MTGYGPKIQLADSHLNKKKPDVTAAEKLINEIRTALDRGPGLTVKSPDYLLRSAESLTKVPANTLKLTDISNRIATAKQSVKTMRAKLAEIERDILNLGDLADPESANSDPTYKKHHAEVLKDYKQMVKDLQDDLVTAQGLFKKTQALNGNPLLQSNPDGMLRVAQALLTQLDDAKKIANDHLKSARESSGAIKKKIEKYKLDPSIQDFEPLLTRGITLNAAVQKVWKSGKKQLAGAADTLAQSTDTKVQKGAVELKKKVGG